ncbi:unnamed protein product, partial [marine sediment metagenome]
SIETLNFRSQENEQVAFTTNYYGSDCDVT